MEWCQSSERKEIPMELLVLVLGLIALDLLALRFAQDSRDGFVKTRRGIGTDRRHLPNPTFDRMLAREIRAARQRRIEREQDAASPLREIEGDIAQAA
jgi:hypothetical protein